MCGFAGFCDENMQDAAVNEHIAKEMTDRIRHRGPDDSGIYCDPFVTLGFARLKIIDLCAGAQPMTSPDNRYVICFNGEIYNYKELKEEQIRDFSEEFYTESDTEVLLSVLSRYGKRGLEKLRGMFSIVLYDKEEHSLMLVRDPFGIKPLYYGVFDGCFMFASEIKAFLSHPKFKKELNREMLPYYLQFQYVPTEMTAFAGVYRLMPGTLAVYKSGQIEKQRYFDMPVFEKNRYKGYSFFAESDGQKRSFLPYKKRSGEVSSRLLKVLDASVKRHMRSDVKVGGFLSGGVDSGLVCALAEPSEAFTVGFKRADFDERARAVKTADELGIPLTSIEVDANDFFGALESVQYFSDEPYANLSAVPLYLLAKKASERVGVIISGEGADELFGGYEWYADSHVGKIYRALPTALRKKAAKKALQGRIGDFLRRNAGDAEKEFIGQAKIMTDSEAYSVLSDKYKVLKSPSMLTDPHLKRVENASLLRKKMYLDTQLWMPFDILSKADKMTMAHSLELRVPYLDLAVFSIAEGCADSLLMRGKTGKYVLRRAAAKVLDGETAYRPKKGFPVPFRSWIRDKKYAKILENAFTGAIGREFFNTERLLEMLENHINGSQNNARVLYTVYAFIVWYEVYFVKETGSTAVLDMTESENFAYGQEKLLFDTENMSIAAKRKGKIKAEKGFEEIHTDNFGL